MHKSLIYLHIIHLLKSSTCFEHYPAYLQEVYVVIVQDVQLKRGPYFNMSNLFTKIYNMLYYTTNLYLQ